MTRTPDLLGAMHQLCTYITGKKYLISRRFESRARGALAADSREWSLIAMESGTLGHECLKRRCDSGGLARREVIGIFARS
jgi:hypothetical protein